MQRLASLQRKRRAITVKTTNMRLLVIAKSFLNWLTAHNRQPSLPISRRLPKSAYCARSWSPNKVFIRPSSNGQRRQGLLPPCRPRRFVLSTRPNLLKQHFHHGVDSLVAPV